MRRNCRKFFDCCFVKKQLQAAQTQNEPKVRILGKSHVIPVISMLSEALCVEAPLDISARVPSSVYLKL